MKKLLLIALILLTACGGGGGGGGVGVGEVVNGDIEYYINPDDNCFESHNAHDLTTINGNVDPSWSIQVLYWNCVDFDGYTDKDIRFVISKFGGYGCYQYRGYVVEDSSCGVVETPTPTLSGDLIDFNVYNAYTSVTFEVSIQNNSNVPVLVQYKKSWTIDGSVETSSPIVLGVGERHEDGWEEDCIIYGSFDVTMELVNFDGEVLDSMTKGYSF